MVEKLKSCTDNKQVSKFQKLTPIDDADLTGYEEALDHAFKKEDKIKNIAIIGSYGSGKSSILYTYEKDNPELKFIHVSFLHFKEKINENIDLIKYIILNDYIDENYEEYVTYFYPINISKNDMEKSLIICIFQLVQEQRVIGL